MSEAAIDIAVQEPAVPPGGPPVGPLGLGAAWRRLPLSGRIGALVVAFWLVTALAGPWIAPYPIGAIVAGDVFEPPSLRHLLGSDYLGRDVLSRMLTGARYTVGLALASAAAASFMGASLALLAAVSARWIDEALSRFMDAMISLPSKVLALVMVAAFGASTPLLLMTLAVTYTPGAYRIARALAVGLNQMDYVQAARARGEGRFYIARSEILPNMINPVLADFGLRFGFVVLLLSGLSFLGLGVQPPNADLGSLVRENTSGLAAGAPAIVAPAVAIATLTIAVNLLIDGLSGGRLRAGGTGE
ncbi:MAG: ABC transporter permease [Alphaproteobacteria bacterium]|nr:ABC transporter permease [Alphaproteobacteria bacterium]